MSIESAVYFYKKVAEDDTFRAQAESLSRDQILEFSRKYEFDFTLEELEDVCEYVESESRELDMEALDDVVGGLNLGVLNPVIEPFKLMPQSFHNSGKHNGWW